MPTRLFGRIGGALYGCLLGLLILILPILIQPALAQTAPSALTYDLSPQQVAENVWVFEGSRDFFNRRNGGNIVNTGFILTDAGVVVIDTGPSTKYGEEMRAVIAETTDNAPIVAVFNTHLHPDHFLGNQAFEDVPIWATAITKRDITAQGDDLSENLYRLVGDWMRSTFSVPPSHVITEDHMEFGSHRLQLLVYSGHSSSDLAIFDETSGVLFAGDLVFNKRLPTLPHASAGMWIASLQLLKSVPFSVLVPGHGPVSDNTDAMDATAAYVAWFDRTMRQMAESGMDLTEVLGMPLPPPFDQWEPGLEEYQRSVLQRFPEVEAQALRPAQ